ncbi:MAG TPA: elongation factor P hydroxylase [Gammaproteobacteria bacterium]
MHALKIDNVPGTSGRFATDDLARLFGTAFAARENTLLLPHADAWRAGWSGADAAEPVYLPADAACPFNRIVFAHGFFASALHEIAHWCLAGAKRRARVDYGYWYAPDDRDTAKQAEFERVEARPQAIEWAFCLAAGFRFAVSADNLSGVPVDRARFTRAVHRELCRFTDRGFPPRARTFITALEQFYGCEFRMPADV